MDKGTLLFIVSLISMFCLGTAMGLTFPSKHSRPADSSSIVYYMKGDDICRASLKDGITLDDLPYFAPCDVVSHVTVKENVAYFYPSLQVEKGAWIALPDTLQDRLLPVRAELSGVQLIVRSTVGSATYPNAENSLDPKVSVTRPKASCCSYAYEDAPPEPPVTLKSIDGVRVDDIDPPIIVNSNGVPMVDYGCKHKDRNVTGHFDDLKVTLPFKLVVPTEVPENDKNIGNKSKHNPLQDRKSD